MKILSKMLAVASLVVISFNSLAAIPRASPNTYGMFLSNSPYALPSVYFQKTPLQRYEGGTDSYVLYAAYASGGGTPLTQTIQWNSSALSVAPGASWYTLTNWSAALIKGLPTFTEAYGGANGQCVAFAKAAIQDKTGTASWKADSKVIPDPGVTVYGDDSYLHEGKMIAFFGTNAIKGATFPQNSSSPGHVGIFLKYAYDKTSPPYKIIGFWIADENYEGDPSNTNKDGQIRKHLILLNPIPNGKGATYGHTFAGKYWFVNI